ncbi:hypothetical protein C8P66_12163 [Humitalea rosea]|uniref:Uncharacterized protein n=1 Tax=Humitalea rosea TaxID=990373 RepID=A0A2W7I8H9_9PROT|nr:hypothetical protein [Humitalea rosea]PZW41355.1 hypothetical protein C8P66_12163 [Humitalea rosea]
MPRHKGLEHLARRYLASRGTPPMVEDPVGVALPRLRAEVAQARRTARRDLGLGLGLTLAGLISGGSILVMPFGNDVLMAMLRLHLVPLMGLGGALWGAILFERAGPVWMAARNVVRHLSTGALVEAFQLALSGLPAQVR